MRKVLALWIAVAVVSVGVVFAVGPSLVSGQQLPSASRSLPSDPVPAGSEFTVTITGATGYGAAGSVVETLPDGFSYVSGSSSLPPSGVDERDEQTVAFQLFGDSGFHYKVTASGMEGNHSFSGVVIHFDRVTSGDVGGDSTVTVEPAPCLRSQPLLLSGVSGRGRRCGGDHQCQRLRRFRRRGGDSPERVHLRNQQLGRCLGHGIRADRDLHPGG